MKLRHLIPFIPIIGIFLTGHLLVKEKSLSPFHTDEGDLLLGIFFLSMMVQAGTIALMVLPLISK